MDPQSLASSQKEPSLTDSNKKSQSIGRSSAQTTGRVAPIDPYMMQCAPDIVGEATITKLAGLARQFLNNTSLLGKSGTMEPTLETITEVLKYLQDPDKLERDELQGRGTLADLEHKVSGLPNEDQLNKRLARLQDLEIASRASFSVLQLFPNDDLDRALCLGLHGSIHFERFKRTGHLEDGRLATKSFQQAVSLTPSGHADLPFRLGGLGLSYHYVFDRFGATEDMNKAIEYSEQAVLLTPDGDQHKPAWLTNLGNLYTLCFDRSGSLETIEKAIICHNRAIALLPLSHPDRAGWLLNLGSAHSRRFDHQGVIDDLEQAISYSDQAVHLTPDSHPSKPDRLNNLGSAHLTLFERLGQTADLDKAVGSLETAVHLTPDSNPNMSKWLGNLSRAYCASFERFGHLQDINKAIQCKEQTVLLTSDDDPTKPRYLSNLGNYYALRFRQLGCSEDLEKALACQDRAVSLVPDGDSDKARQLSNLGYLHLIPGTLDSTKKAVEYLRQAVVLTPDEDPHKGFWLSNLGASYNDLFQHSGLSEDLMNAMQAHKQAALIPTARPSLRFQNAHGWALACTVLHGSPMEAYTHAIKLLPEVVWLGTPVKHRYERLTDNVQSLVVEAVAAAIVFHEFRMAIEWFEAGRAIVWTQMLQLRAPLDLLSSVDSALAEQLTETARMLEQASLPNSTQTMHSFGGPLPGEAAQQRRLLAMKWEGLLRQARCLPGFHNFLQNKSLSDLMAGANCSTVVMINVQKHRCDAIAIVGLTNTVRIVPNLNFLHEKATDARLKMLASLRGAHVHARSTRRPVFQTEDTQETLEGILQTLWEDVVRPVLHDLGYLCSRSAGDELPRITWCANGPLAFLPLHAAGRYDKPGARVFDYVVSSYAPTLSSLIKSVPAASNFRGVLAVGQADAAGSPALPGTVAEIEAIQVTAGHMPFTRLEGSMATTGAVLNAMETHSWVHLACHASQNIGDPTASAFKLRDGDLSLAEITRKSLKHADFAFLSACQTATGDENLPDEAVHLAAGMLMAGYSSVVATMWSIQDQDAPLVAEQVYAHIMEGGVPDSSRAARALHKAVASLRSMIGEKDFTRWVPYIHMGR